MATIGEIYTKHGEGLKRWTQNIISPDEEAEDIVHDAFARALAQEDRVGDQENQLSYIRGIIVNRVFEVYRERVRFPMADDVEVEFLMGMGGERVMPQQVIEDERVISIVERALTRMSPRYLEVLKTEFTGVEDTAAKAKRLGVTKGYYAVVKCRALKVLRNIIEELCERGIASRESIYWALPVILQ